jgi:hypothetical protein
MSEPNQHSRPPIPFLHGDGVVKTTWSALASVIALLVAGVVAYVAMRGDVQQHSRELQLHERRFEVIDQKLDVQRQLLLEIRADQKAVARERASRP